MSEAKQDKSQLVLPERMNETAPVRMPTEVSPMALVQIAVQRGDSLDNISKLMDLADRHQATIARRAFVVAMAKFKENPPEILKDRHVSYTKKDGSTTSYNHASLANVCNQIVKGLSEAGITHRWTTDHAEGKIRVTCILTHIEGHSESTFLPPASPDESGGKNSIQAIASTVTYLQRYTLLAATGLAAGEDEDGRDPEPEPEPITAEHLDTLDTMIAGVAKDKAKFTVKFVAHLRVNALADLPDIRYKEAVDFLESIRKSQAEAA